MRVGLEALLDSRLGLAVSGGGRVGGACRRRRQWGQRRKMREGGGDLVSAIA